MALVESAASADPAVNTRIPTTKISRRPNRSPSAAPVRSSTANVRVYALTVHSSCDSEACRLWRITGSAEVTTRLSSVTMKSATDVIPNVQSMLLLLCIVSLLFLIVERLDRVGAIFSYFKKETEQCNAK